jgi:hypothetical protein
MRYVLPFGFWLFFAVAGCVSPNSKSSGSAEAGLAVPVKNAQTAAVCAILQGTIGVSKSREDYGAIFFQDMSPAELEMVKSRLGMSVPRLDTDLTHCYWDEARWTDRITKRDAMMIRIERVLTEPKRAAFRVALEYGNVGGRLYVMEMEEINGGWKVVSLRLVGMS